MLKKTITYTDWNGNEQTEDFYFNLTQTECAELEYSVNGQKPLTESIQEIVKAKDMGSIIRILKQIILTAYGEKSEDGRRFRKNDDIREGFEECAAFDKLYMSLATDPEAAAEFIGGIMPSEATKNLGPNPKRALLNKMDEFNKTGEVNLS